MRFFEKWGTIQWPGSIPTGVVNVLNNAVTTPLLTRQHQPQPSEIRQVPTKNKKRIAVAVYNHVIKTMLYLHMSGSADS